MSTKIGTEDDVGVIDRVKEEKAPPPQMYDVIMHNDDFNPMDFVTWVLRDHFNKTLEQASQLMLKVHHEGTAVAGTYSKDVAATKIDRAMDEAKKAEHPFQLTMEPR